MVGDGMQCPPSPLLFDPSVTLEPSLRDVAEAPMDILALEDTDRASSSSPLVPQAEQPAQVGPGWGCPKSLSGMGWDFSSRKFPPSSSSSSPSPTQQLQSGCAHGLGGIRSARVALWVAQCHPRPVWGHWGCLALPAVGASSSQQGLIFWGGDLIFVSQAKGSPFFLKVFIFH